MDSLVEELLEDHSSWRGKSSPSLGPLTRLRGRLVTSELEKRPDFKMLKAAVWNRGQEAKSLTL